MRVVLQPSRTGMLASRPEKFNRFGLSSGIGRHTVMIRCVLWCQVSKAICVDGVRAIGPRRVRAIESKLIPGRDDELREDVPGTKGP
jgi:hypothetical protein